MDLVPITYPPRFFVQRGTPHEDSEPTWEDESEHHKMGPAQDAITAETEGLWRIDVRQVIRTTI